MAASSKRSKARTKAASSVKVADDHVYVPNRAAWRRWLKRHHASSRGIWLVFDKKSARSDRLAYADAVEEALCFGWIDSVLHPMDGDRYKQRYTPRKPKSAWSKVNKDRVARLTEQGLMTAAGLACVEEAQRNGGWAKLDSVEAFVVPPDLATALAGNPLALRNFEAYAPSVRKGFLYWLNGAKRPETRAQRVGEVVRFAAKNVKSRLPNPKELRSS